ncbi:small oligopeptide transporter, partial [Panaeolus papilionaceus]
SSTYTGRHSGFASAFDPNYDSDSVLEDDSPYPEVRSAVANFDDPLMPAATVRAWVLGIIWAILLPGMNQFFYFRYPSVSIGGLVAQLLVFPIGRAWARICPRVSVFGYEMNPGPFTIKEHVLVTIMATVGAQSAYATDIVAVQWKFYDQEFSFAYNWMLVMSTQLIGFSMGGFARRFLVDPPSMIWPNTLVSCALFNTLHSQTYAGIGPRDGLTRERFFLYIFVAAIVWCTFGLAGYVRTRPAPWSKSYRGFTQVCWIAPDNVKINQLFGYHTGLGFSLLTLDWAQIAYIGSPLATPWWAEANVMIGFFFFYWFLTPLLYYNNVWQSQYLPISALTAFDNTGQRYDVRRVIGPDLSLDMEAYKNYSPLYISTTFAISYGLSFLSISSTITHAIIHFWRPIRLQFNSTMREQPDIHARLMSHYPQVPEWYYACIFIVTFVFACVCIELWPTGMTIWALIIALLIALVYVIPIGMIQAVTNRQVGLNVITELIIGFMIPGKPIAMMMFKTFGYVTMAQAMQFTADFKLGHYMKISPRPMFWAQVVATIIAGTVQLAVQAWMFSNINGLCDEKQKNNFTCVSTQVFGTASVIWGVIGPGLQFTKGQIYYFFFLIGAACPVLLWLYTRRYPSTIFNYLNLIFSGVGQIPPATAVNYVPWAIIGFIFQYIVRRKHFLFWAKYNYVLSAALDAGTAIGVVLVFFCLQYPLDGRIGENTIQNWWGNTVHTQTADWKGLARGRSLQPGMKFG